ncbi:MAG: alpha/beta hydrolase [Burkholderiales bacterium]|nr:alpha/beta hydrolase [Burkholderiales bacterium]
MLDAIEIETGPEAQASVIWLHGLGADGSDFEPIVGELALPARPIRFVFPHAPTRPVTINGGMVMRAWYDILGNDVARREDAAGVRASQRGIEALIARERERGTAAGRIVLAGFSQGGAIALQTALRHPERLAGIMALSTYVPIADSLTAEAHAANRATPIFMAHGVHDPIVPVALGRRSRDLLASLGYAVEWREYPMPHAVCAEEIVDIGAWLRSVLA